MKPPRMPEPRLATKDELAWCSKMRKLMLLKPESITLFCNGHMHVLCTKAVDAQVKKVGCMPQPIKDISSLGPADGGDF